MENIKFVPAQFPNTELKNHLDDFKKRIENASGEDQFAFITSLTGSTFEQNNKSRVSRGVTAYSEKEYVDSYIQIQNDSIKDSEQIIANEKELVKRLKDRLDAGDNHEELVTLQKGLQSYLEGEEDFQDMTLEEIQNILSAYQDKHDKDTSLDQLSGVLTYIQLQEESIEVSKKLLEKLNGLPITE